MQSSARVAVHGGDTNGTFDAKCIGHRRVMRLTSPSMEAHAAVRPRFLIYESLRPAAGYASADLGGFAPGLRAVYGRRTAGGS